MTDSAAATPSRLRRLVTSSNLRRFAIYVAVGLAGFAVDFGLLVFFREVVGTPVWVATTIAFWASLAVVFLTNKYVTFGARGMAHRQIVRYFVLLGVNYLATLGIIALADRLGVGYQVGKVVAVAMTTLWNFFVYQLWVFREAERPPAPSSPTVGKE
ncbi:GtrA family protein [Pseudonocardia dioxanivorans]|uniref:GtrA family protein n=1 Tax=Pseudonocardia dioxanivorans TaxID=240495 RepID=UPI00131A53F8|nr:GtrA family protein [Pseudonocardia dioxanivorans]